MTNICIVCNKKIINRHGNSKTCSDECSYKLYRQSASKNQQANRVINRISCKLIVELIKDEIGCMNGCKDVPFVALDFHHITEDKYDSIAKLVHLGRMDRLLDELPKCILTCANCHRQIHYKRDELW